MSQKKQFQTRLDPDIAERVEQYADENNLSHSEAVRRLVRTGIEASGGPTRDEIAADLNEIRSEIRGVRDELDEDDNADSSDNSSSILGLRQSAPLPRIIGYMALVLAGYVFGTIPI